MKSLADLKRDAHLYKWKLIHNSWFKNIPPHLNEYRTVSRTQSNGIYFNTCKDGAWSESFLEFPKAKELYIKTNNEHIELYINVGLENEEPLMIYQLEKYIF